MTTDNTIFYVLAAALGGLIGGLGHALMSDSKGFGNADTAGTKDYSGIRDLTVGFFSGLVWLLPNEKLWYVLPANSPTPGLGDYIVIALQTMIIGLSGSGWLTSYLDSSKLKGAVADAAKATADPSIANQISQAKTVPEIVGLVGKLDLPKE